MKKVILSLLTIIFVYFTGCVGPAPEPVAPTNELPEADGKLVIEFTDPNLNVTPSITAATGDNVTISLNIKKSPDGGKPRYLEVYVADEPNKRGTRVFDAIKLKNIDDQTKTIEYTISASTGKNYMYFEVLDNNDKRTRKQITVNIASNAQIASWSGIALGAQTNSLGSRLSSSTGDVYRVCDLDSNIRYVDITYAAIGSPVTKPTILSNPRRAVDGLSTTITDSNCAGSSSGGGSATYFVAAPANTDFTGATDASLAALTVSSSNPQEVIVEAGKVYAFLNGRGKKGLIRINSIDSGVSGKVVFDVKVQM
ncbi:hypothetical protein SAMN04515674_110150 [Pseudarcicella hirudinis]|uniref:Uncharacterized protein n=1 Tax=Pseudarcicella hirudinis TaxID=1079859 RepID=A0A1I5VZK9_9BACT|nr:hypothetical protein [Pseudarcicella hirudinis]SFQ12777.1 hypothetical protein SAMN04515674_110150 [Pseudarcicella hirudinis]